jgi:hypothetical protein
MFWFWLVVGLLIWSAVVLLIAKWIGAGMGSPREKAGRSGAESPSKPGGKVVEPGADPSRAAAPPELVKR